MADLRKTLACARREYEDIPIPADLNERVQNSMRNKASSTTYRIPWGKFLLRTLAAACITIVIGVNVSAEMAQGLSEVPVVGAFVRLVTFRNYTHSQNNAEAEIAIPQISGLDNAALEKELNRQFNDYGEELITRYQADLKTLGETSYEAVQSSYSVKAETDRYLVVEISALFVQASGQEMNRYYTIDKKAQKLLTLQELFQPGSDYTAVISKEIISQMQVQMAQDDAVVYFIGAEEPMPFEGIKQDHQFYVNTDGKLVIPFDEYEVAPGAMGAVEFLIPTETLGDILISDGIIK